MTTAVDLRVTSAEKIDPQPEAGRLKSRSWDSQRERAKGSSSKIGWRVYSRDGAVSVGMMRNTRPRTCGKV